MGINKGSGILNIGWAALPEKIRTGSTIGAAELNYFRRFEDGIGFDESKVKTLGKHRDVSGASEAITFNEGIGYASGGLHAIKSSIEFYEKTVYDFKIIGTRNFTIDTLGFDETLTYGFAVAPFKRASSYLGAELAVEYTHKINPRKSVYSETSFEEGATFEWMRSYGSPMLPRWTRYRRTIIEEILSFEENTDYDFQHRDTFGYDIGKDVFYKYTNMKVINANVLNSGNALNNVNLLMDKSGRIKKYPSEYSTGDVATVTTKTINMEKGVLQGLSLSGVTWSPNPIPGTQTVVKHIRRNPFFQGNITMYVHVEKDRHSDSDAEDSLTAYRVGEPYGPEVKANLEPNYVPDSAGYGRAFFAQLKGFFRIDRLIFSYKQRIEENKK